MAISFNAIKISLSWVLLSSFDTDEETEALWHHTHVTLWLQEHAVNHHIQHALTDKYNMLSIVTDL